MYLAPPNNLTPYYNRRRVLMINDLPDDVLLEIFDFYVVRNQDLDFRQSAEYSTKRKIESWQLLVHVCRRWRALVFGSPRRLSLQISYGPGYARHRKSLDIWPPLPLIINFGTGGLVGNVITGLKHRICQINLNSHSTGQVRQLWTRLQEPIPELAGLYMSYEYESNYSDWHMQVLPDPLLGGSAPRLRHFYLGGIPFQELPKLLLSATRLVGLYLVRIPNFGYISPEDMATCLSTLTSLETLQLHLMPPLYYSDPGLDLSPDLDLYLDPDLDSDPDPDSDFDSESRHPLPLIRSLLPTLANFRFKGAVDYLEKFVARVDAPQLDQLSITFFNTTYLEAPELNQFISRTPMLTAYDEAHLVFDGDGARVRLRQSYPEPSDDRMVEVKIYQDWQLSTLARVISLSLHFLSIMKNLYIYEDPLVWKGNKNIGWLDLLLPFTGVKNLYLSKKFSPRIALALQELTGRRTTEVLPALQNVFLEGFRPSKPAQGGIARFISARQLINRPVAISAWQRYWKEVGD